LDEAVRRWGPAKQRRLIFLTASLVLIALDLVGYRAQLRRPSSIVLPNLMRLCTQPGFFEYKFDKWLHVSHEQPQILYGQWLQQTLPAKAIVGYVEPDLLLTALDRPLLSLSGLTSLQVEQFLGLPEGNERILEYVCRDTETQFLIVRVLRDRLEHKDYFESPISELLCKSESVRSLYELNHVFSLESRDPTAAFDIEYVVFSRVAGFDEDYPYGFKLSDYGAGTKHPAPAGMWDYIY
jgi:hypothetical protein